MHKNHTKKHIAIVVQNLHNGGAERMAANLSAELAKYYEVYLIVFDAADAIYPYGGKLIDLKVPPLQEGSVPQRVWNSLSRIRKLRYLKKRLKIDATISHMDGANLVNILSDMGDRRISVYHSMPSFETTDAFADRMLQRAIGHCSDRYLVVSGPALQDMHRNFGVPLDKLQCIYNFVDIPKAHQMMAEALPQETVDFYQRHDKVIVHAGRLIPLKAQQRLIRILGGFRAQGKNVSLVLLGEGEERGKLEECVRKTGVEDHVLMPGEVRNPFPYFKHADVFALCSVYEGLPMVLIEALACGCPVVSLDMPSGAREILAPDTDVTQTAQEIEYAKYGILTPPYREVPQDSAENAEAERTDTWAEGKLARALEEMLYRQEIRQKYLSSCAEAAAAFSEERIIAQWRELIEG